MDAPLKIFAGSSHKELATSICDYLGVPLGKSHRIEFSNENMMVQIDENVRVYNICTDEFRLALPVEAHAKRWQM